VESGNAREWREAVLVPAGRGVCAGAFFRFWILDFGFWILDFGFWILDFGLFGIS
jgi:hypothetical protein